ncbi:hypothetical protein AAMO2058_001232800 [Amorphochlora amoebiformis]|uniref:Uncharacterized protein n=1 Tax=Amorphochlora amoebiformis TaxID=1561963 RepID=A0A7S0GUU2_9EUKA|mmetsp:Transcript_1622/g.2298  ORF Transcript_1622/g.2298 Transcript_1622/m.2298 type:complete len:153 (+) Transcript_1622:351-809(+)
MFCQELAKQVERDVLPILKENGIKLIAVGIGTGERAKEFCAHIPFPEENLFADPENACYTALGLKKGVATTFFRPETPFAILARANKDGAKDLLEATKRWKPWIPPKLDQGLQQGGTFVFKGDEQLFEHFDPSTGAHANLDDVLSAAVSTPV